MDPREISIFSDPPASHKAGSDLSDNPPICARGRGRYKQDFLVCLAYILILRNWRYFWHQGLQGALPIEISWLCASARSIAFTISMATLTMNHPAQKPNWLGSKSMAGVFLMSFFLHTRSSVFRRQWDPSFPLTNRRKLCHPVVTWKNIHKRGLALNLVKIRRAKQKLAYLYLGSLYLLISWWKVHFTLLISAGSIYLTLSDFMVDQFITN